MLNFATLALRSLIVLSLAAGVTSCSRQDKTENVFTVRGIIRAPFDREARTISIEHEAIPNYMPAMTMPFYTDATEVRDLSVGDRVEFEFRVAKTSRAINFRKIGRVAAAATPEASASGGGEKTIWRRLRPGDGVPSFALIDQDNKPFDADSLRGEYSVLTFIFTRCPVPEFCPLIGKKFQALQAQLQNATGTRKNDVRLLSVTIDPDHDQPAVLRSYGKSLGADFNRWRFLTGSTAEIEKLTKLFAVRAERNNGSLDHTLATALIGPQGDVVEIWRGNAWQPEEIVEKIRAL